MAQTGAQLDQKILHCSICVDLLLDPVTLTCGHSFCMRCIETVWDKEDEKGIHSCPQCRKTFTPRPAVVKNTMLAAVAEELRKTRVQAASADHDYAGAEDVACEVCTGRKLKASRSCVDCSISFCEQHVQPHYEIPAYAKHKLVEPSMNRKENVCSRHDEVMKLFCRTDQQSICYLCSVDEHKGHDAVSAAGERAEKQTELEGSRIKIHQRIRDREKDVELLQQEVEAINHSADKVVKDSEKIFTEMIQQVRSQQEDKVSRVKEHQEEVRQEIAELKRRDAELKKLANTDNHFKFLHDYSSLSQISESTGPSRADSSPLKYFEGVTAAVTEFRDKLQDVLRENWDNMSSKVTEVDVVPPQEQPETREDFLKYLCYITLDPNTSHPWLWLSQRNRRATYKDRRYSDPQDGFVNSCQVLSKESLTGRHYWEMKWGGAGVCVAVAYKDIDRRGAQNESGFGHNDKSWALDYYNGRYEFWYNNIHTPLSVQLAFDTNYDSIGVYLDHHAGVLSFYVVDYYLNMKLIHTVNTKFTQPLHAGIRFDSQFADWVELLIHK